MIMKLDANTLGLLQFARAAAHCIIPASCAARPWYFSVSRCSEPWCSRQSAATWSIIAFDAGALERHGSVWIADLFGSQIQGDLFGAAQWRIYQGAAKEFGFATSDSSP